jgi:LPS-assembly protein
MHSAYAAPAAPELPVLSDETQIEADALVGQKEREVEATGDAILRQDGKRIRADELRYFPDARELDAQGAVVLEQQQGDKVSGPHLHLNLQTGRGKMEQPEFQFQENYGRGTAEVMELQDKLHYTLSNATYTTCPAGDNDWRLNMSILQLDRDEQIGTAQHATVEFMGVPFVYAPWMDFPLDDRRKSGFLAPIYEGASNNGLGFTLPYYWNIAPNADATLAPRVLSKRGLQLNNEFRYLGVGYSGELHADVLSNDYLAKRNRGRYVLKHSQSIMPGVNGYIDYSEVSDNAYFRDGLGVPGALSSAAQVNLMQQGGVNFTSNGWNSAVRMQRYQTLQDPLAPILAPYSRMPQITTSAVKSVSDANLVFLADYTEFSHPTLLNGKRLVINPSISYPLVNESAFYIMPKVALHSTQYEMGSNNQNGLPSGSRTLPMFSMDSGMFFERDTNWFARDFIQTLEPRAFYVYVPYRKQDLLPNFDSALADFNMVQMFSDNRFLGNDRIGDANQATFATTTRLLAENNGAERLRVTLGERFSFITPRVNLLTPSGSTAKSDILLSVGAGMNKTLYFDSLIDFDPNQSRTQQYGWTARYRPEVGKTFNFAYQFQRGITQQITISEQWPLTQHWGSVAKMNYSFPDKRIVNSIAGLEYNETCWTMRFVAQYTTTTTQQTTTGIFAQLDLNNFMQAGSDPFALLKQNIPGYTKTNATHLGSQSSGMP